MFFIPLSSAITSFSPGVFGGMNEVVPQYEYTVPKSYMISMLKEYNLTNTTNILADMTKLHLSYPAVEVNGDSHLPSVHSVDYYDSETMVTDKHFKVRVPNYLILSLRNSFRCFEGLDDMSCLQDLDTQMVYGKFERL